MRDSLRGCALRGHSVAFLGTGSLADKGIEHYVLLVPVALATTSVCWGIRIHRQRRILVLFGAALFLMLAGREFEE